MPFCPKCESEYEAGVEKCADCGELLVAHLPPEEEDPQQEIIFEPSDRLVQIAAFQHQIGAHLCKARLESEGIDCFLADENLSYLGPFAGEHRGIKLQVRESDAGEAVEILRQDPPETEVEIEGLRCPRCGSPDVTRQKHSPALIFMSLLLLGIPFLFMRKKWNCRACWHTWKAY